MYTEELKLNFYQALMKNSVMNHAQLAERRLKLLQDILDICYNYDYDLDKLKKNLYRVLNIKSMKERQIIDFELHKNAVVQSKSHLSPTELDLHCLLCFNFSPRELRVIFNHKHPESIYNRISRIKRKLRKNNIYLKSQAEQK